MLIGIEHFVRAQALHLRSERVRHRLDRGGVDRVELFDEAQDFRQAVDLVRQLRLADGEAREVCDVLHIVAGEAHAGQTLDAKNSGKRLKKASRIIRLLLVQSATRC